MSEKIDLSRFHNEEYHAGRSLLVQIAWFFLGLPILRSPLLPSSGLRRILLRLFGAQIGGGAVIKPGVRIKYPWRLKAGNNCWFGEDCWIDNLAQVTMGDNVCVSQGVYICTGNHDWSDPAFGLITKPIVLCDGAWVAARATLAPGALLEEGAIVGFGSVVAGRVPAYEIFGGNPATYQRQRRIGKARQPANFTPTETPVRLRT